MKNKLDKATTKRFNDWKKLCFDKPTDNETKAFVAHEKQKSYDEGKKYGLDLVRNSINFNILLREVEDAKRQELRASINKLKEV